MEDTEEEREGNIRQLFESVLGRINHQLNKEEKIVILDKHLNKAVKQYCDDYKKVMVVIEGN